MILICKVINQESAVPYPHMGRREVDKTDQNPIIPLPQDELSSSNSSSSSLDNIGNKLRDYWIKKESAFNKSQSSLPAPIAKGISQSVSWNPFASSLNESIDPSHPQSGDSNSNQPVAQDIPLPESRANSPVESVTSDGSDKTIKG